MIRSPHFGSKHELHPPPERCELCDRLLVQGRQHHLGATNSGFDLALLEIGPSFPELLGKTSQISGKPIMLILQIHNALKSSSKLTSLSSLLNPTGRRWPVGRVNLPYDGDHRFGSLIIVAGAAPLSWLKNSELSQSS